MPGENPMEQMAQQAAQGVMQQGGNFFSNLISSPFKALAGFGKGAFSGIFKTGIMASAVAGGLLFFAPDLVYGVLNAVGLKDVALGLGKMAATNGPLAIAGVALGTGAAIGGGIGGISGLLGSLGGAQQPRGSGLGSMVGTGLTIATVAAVGIGAVVLATQHNKDPQEPAPPSPTPPGTPRAPGARGR